MDEGFDAGLDTSSDVSVSESIEPLDDVSVEESANMDVSAGPISEQEMSELQNEAAALDIQPLDDGVEQGYEPSALSNIINAGAAGAEPGRLAQIGGDILAPPGAEEAVAQGLQMGANMGVAGSREFMDATIRQHGKSPAVEYNEMLIAQAIDEKPQG